MSNSLLTASIITKECMMELKNQLGFAKNVNTQYDDQFAVKGAKVGDTINVRKPSRYEVTSGSALNIQDSVDQSAALTLDSQKHVGMAFSSKDLALSIDEFKERYIKPAMTALANDVDYSGQSAMYKKVWHSVGVPSDTALPSSLKGFNDARAKIALAGGPKSGFTALVDPLVGASLVEGLKSLPESSSQIAKQYEEGYMFKAAGCKFIESANVVKHTVGALGGTPTVTTTISSQGATSVVTQAWTSAAANRLKAGDVFTIANVYAVNPQTRQSTGQLQQFTVTSDFASDSSGNGTVSFTPAIYSTGQYQNVNSLPQSSAAILVFGHASSYASVVCPQNLVFHKDAFILGMADLHLPQGVDMAARASDPDAGLSIRMVRQYDINNDRIVARLDVLYGWLAANPEFACRVVGQPA